MLAAAVAAAGERLHSVEIAQVRYHPGRSITASYRVGLAGGPALLVAHGGARMPAGAVVLDDGEVRVGVWRFPNDPLLPGLPHAVDGTLLPPLLARLGIGGKAEGVRRRAYRPTRRAVVEVVTHRGPLFLKVVRPERAAALAERHVAIAAALEAPLLVAADLDLGLLVLGSVPGVPLRDLLRPGATAALPAAARLLGLLDRLPPLAIPAPGPLQRVAHHTGLLAAVVPDRAAQLHELAIGLRPGRAGPLVPVHGDFHPGQVMVRDGDPAGLVDVDAAGTGERADDVATMLGYLAATTADADPAGRAAPYAAALAAGCAGLVEPGELRPRVVAATLGFATMPFVTQRPGWPALVRRRVESATAAAAGEWWV